MEFGSLNKKGQTSIEFLLVFVIMLIYIQIIIQPSVIRVSESAKAVSSVGQTKLAAMNLAESINEVYLISGESKKQVWLFIDRNSTIRCDASNKKIKFEVNLGTLVEVGSPTSDAYCEKLAGSNKSKCVGEIQLLDGISLDCANFPDPLDGSESPKALVEIRKDSSGVINVRRI